MNQKGFHPYGDLIGLLFDDCREGRSRCRIEIADKLLNPHGVVHGAVIYSLADTGMGGALYTLLEHGETCATLEIKIAYFQSVSRGTLVCDTRVIDKRKRIASLASEICCGDERIAHATGTFYIAHPEAP